MNQALRQVMLEAAGAGELAGAGVRRGRAEHPVCGDVVTVHVRAERGRVTAFAWQAEGCPACVAVAAAAHSAVLSAPVAEVPSRLAQRLAGLGGLARHERHAERLLLDALAAAGVS